MIVSTQSGDVLQSSATRGLISIDRDALFTRDAGSTLSCPAAGSRRPRARERVVVAAAVDDAEVGVHPSGQAVMLL